jgi:hypothetical protein
MAAIDGADPLDALEARALDDLDARDALFVALDRAREQALPADRERVLLRAARAFAMLDVEGASTDEPRAASAPSAARLSLALGRRALAERRPREAVTHLERVRALAAGASFALGPDEHAAAASDLAHALAALGRAAEANERFREALALAPACEDRRAWRWFTLRASTALAEHARQALADPEAASAFEAEADRVESLDCALEAQENEAVLAFFADRWVEERPPTIPAEALWLQRSTGAVRTAERGGAFDGPECPRIFGPLFDFVCACGAVRGRAAWGAVCAECGVEVGSAARRRGRVGHLLLPLEVIHPAALSRGPVGSLVALLLDLPDERVEAVRAQTRCLRWRAERPRGAETVDPGSDELRAHDEGRGDPALRYDAGEGALCEALARLDVAGAIADATAEQSALAAHRSAATTGAGRARLRWLQARIDALAALPARGGTGGLRVRSVPVLAPERIDRMERPDVLRGLYDALIIAAHEEPARVSGVLAALLRAVSEREAAPRDAG